MNDVPDEEPLPVPPRTPEATSAAEPRSEPSDTIAAVRDLGQGTSSFDFISSVVAGLLLGLGADWLFGTSPWFTIAGVIAGFGSGFYRLWEASKVLEDQARERQERRRG